MHDPILALDGKEDGLYFIEIDRTKSDVSEKRWNVVF